MAFQQAKSSATAIASHRIALAMPSVEQKQGTEELFVTLADLIA